MASNTPRIDKFQKNYLLNSDMRLSQRGTSFAAVADATYTLDRFQYVKTGAMVHTITQDTDAPTLAESDYLFQNNLRMNLTTPDTAIAAGDYCMLMQKIEGYNWANLAQKDFTLSFWVKATLTGTYCVSFGNTAGDQAVPYEYTINVSNTWERKTIHVSASPSAGTWNYTNGIGLYVRWTLAAGTNFQFTAGVWGSGNRWATPNQVNGVNTGATDFRVTGVMLCEGTLTDPEFSTFGKDFSAEVMACQRYYEKTYDLTTNPATVTFTGAVSFNHPGGVGVEGNYYFRASKRVNANPVYYSPQTGASGNFRDTTSGVDRATATLRTGQNNITFSTSGVPAGSPDISGHIVADVEL